MKLIETRPPVPKCPRCNVKLSNVKKYACLYECPKCGAQYTHQLEFKNPFSGKPVKLNLKIRKRKR